MTYVKVSVIKPDGNPGKGGDKLDKITIIAADEVQTFPQHDGNGIVINDNIIMKDGTYAVTLYATQDSIKVTPKSEGATDEKGIMHSVEFTHPGISDAILEFSNYWMNKDVYVVIERCSTGKKHLIGAPCAKLQMSFEGQDDKDATKTKFVFASAQKGPHMFVYNGTITYADVTGTMPADTDTVDLTNGPGQYQCVNNTDAPHTVLDSISNAVDGMVFTLLGSGGSHPSTITVNADMFKLANGTTWTAIAGSTITFKVFKIGVAEYLAMEISRS